MTINREDRVVDVRRQERLTAAGGLLGALAASSCKSLEALPGVSKAVVSYKNKTAVVIYADGRTDVSALTRATTDAGYPSAPGSGGHA
jgi:hypothetical protein